MNKNRDYRLEIGIWLTLLIVLQVSLCNDVFAGAGTNSSEILLISPNARASAMGEAFSAHVDDATAIYWNPGALARAKGMQVALTHSELLNDLRYQFLALSQAIGKNTIGSSLGYLTMGKLIGRDENGVKTADFGAYDMVGSLSIGRPVTQHLSIGLTGKLIQQKIENEKASAIVADIGVLFYGLNDNLTLALGIQNMGKGQKFINKTEDLPLSIRTGIGYKLFKKTLSLNLDTNTIKYLGTIVSVGSEYFLIEYFAFRAGYKYNPEVDSSVGMSAGIGFKLNVFSLDYAYVPFSDLGDTHRISLGMAFGNTTQ